MSSSLIAVAASRSWPNLLAPLVGATIVRFVVPKSSRMLVWGAATGFVLSFFTAVGTNAAAQTKACQRTVYRHAIPSALAPSLLTAATFMTGHLLGTYLPESTFQKIIRNPNAVFAVGGVAGLSAFIASLITGVHAINRACK